MEEMNITKLPEFDDHSAVLFLNDPKTGLEGYIAIHRGGLKAPTFGATRVWNYASKTDALRDALRLSKMMSHKSALAGLPYGGAKAVIISNKPLNPEQRRALLSSYAERLNYLAGKFITGTDMGLNQEDLEFMKNKSDYFVGLKVDPTHFTVLGLMAGLHVCLKKYFGDPSIKGRSFAIEGIGKIGKELLKQIYDEAGNIYVTDINEKNTESAQKDFPKIHVVKPGEIHKLAVDVYSPCASHSVLNEKTVPELQCKIIIGGANNQLENDQIGEKIFQSKILYAPDYIVNAGGLMSVVYEHENKEISVEKLEERVKKIGETLEQILEESQRSNRPTDVVANEKAKSIFANFN